MSPRAVGTNGNRGLPAAGLNAVDEADIPETFVAVNRHGNRGITRRLLNSLSQHEEVGAELRHWQDRTVHM